MATLKIIYFQIHKKLRTKALVLELLAAICLVKGGHDITLKAFDNFKQELNENKRFETLMYYFTHPEGFQIDFMVACMQFINIIVHSVEDFNFRVALQWEFAALGLRECLEKLRTHESDELAVQISGKKITFVTLRSNRINFPIEFNSVTDFFPQNVFFKGIVKISVFFPIEFCKFVAFDFNEFFTKCQNSNS